MDYLIQYEPNAFVTLDIMPHSCYLHYCNPISTDNEVTNLADRLGNLMIAGSDLRFTRNEDLKTLSFNIYWDIDDI